MDNLCHTLLGAALGGAGLRRSTRFGSAALMVAANVPDLDVLVFATGVPPVSFRRGWTHGVVGQLVLPIAVALVFAAVNRWRPPSKEDGGPPFRLGWLLALAYAGLYSHLALDLLNNYGVRVLAPLDWRWFYGDAVFIVDPWLWLVLGVSVWLARRHRAVAARWALVAAVGYIALMTISARVARADVVDAWQRAEGAPPAALMVGPMPVTPFAREVIVDAGDHYASGTFTWWPRAVLFDRTIPKNDRTPEAERARHASSDIRSFLVWSRFPFWTIEPGPRGALVTVRDARFSGRAGFSYSVVVPSSGS